MFLLIPRYAKAYVASSYKNSIVVCYTSRIIIITGILIYTYFNVCTIQQNIWYMYNIYLYFKLCK